jgi:hypothetical protein
MSRPSLEHLYSGHRTRPFLHGESIIAPCLQYIAPLEGRSGSEWQRFRWTRFDAFANCPGARPGGDGFKQTAHNNTCCYTIMLKHLLRHGATRGSRSTISSLARSGQLARCRAPAGATALAVGIAGAAYSLTTTTASCVPTTRAGGAGAAAQPPPDTIQAIGIATEDEAHPIQCLVCQDYFGSEDVVTCLRVCVHIVCETCFAELDARSCVGCRRVLPIDLWTDRNLRVPLATRDPSNDHVNLVPADGATPSTQGLASGSDGDSDSDGDGDRDSDGDGDDEREPARRRPHESWRDRRANDLFGAVNTTSVTDPSLQSAVGIRIVPAMSRTESMNYYLPSIAVALMHPAPGLGLSSNGHRASSLSIMSTAESRAWGTHMFPFNLECPNGSRLEFMVKYTPAGPDEITLQRVSSAGPTPVQTFPAGIRYIVARVPLAEPSPQYAMVREGGAAALALQTSIANERAAMTQELTMHQTEDGDLQSLIVDDGRRVRRRVDEPEALGRALANSVAEEPGRV